MISPTEEELSKLKSYIQDRMKSTIMGPPSALSARDFKKHNGIGDKLRNNVLWDLRLVRQAVFAFIELGSTREWTVSGKPGSAAKTLELINSCVTWDLDTGYVEHSFESSLRRWALDYATIGRIALGTRNFENTSAKPFTFEYIDPTKLFWARKDKKADKRQRLPPVLPEELVWNYGWNTADPMYKSQEIQLFHPIPVGNGMDQYRSPLMLVYSTAVLAWLIEQHDTAQLDGRKIRDIFIVDKGLFDPLVQAIAATLALWSGADPSKEGLPIVETSQTLTAGMKLQDRIATLGLSKIPEAFDRAKFEHTFANDIAGALGLALRHFWQDDSNTNRALEEVQESRQQQKGPLAFVRTIERIMNAGQVVRQYSPPSKPCRFGFVEESDTSQLEAKARALGAYAKGLSDLKAALEGIQLKPGILLAQIQSLGWLPQDIAVEDMVAEGVDLDKAPPPMEPEAGMDTVTQGTTSAPNARDEVTQKAFDPERDLDYGEVTLNSKGVVLANRRPVYSLSKILKRETDLAETIASNAK